MDTAYPALSKEIKKRGIKKCAISSALGISDRALHNKLLGITNFTWPEVCKIQQVFFPDLDKDYLFATKKN